MARLIEPPLKLHGVPLNITMNQTNEVVYSMLPERDPDWTFTDAAGHRHFYDGRRVPTLLRRHGYPTLETVEVGTYFCHDCCEEHTEYETRCPLCSEVITPGTRPPNPFGTVIPGVTEITAELAGGLGPEEFEFTLEGTTFLFRLIGSQLDSIEDPVTFQYVGTPK